MIGVVMLQNPSFYDSGMDAVFLNMVYKFFANHIEINLPKA